MRFHSKETLLSIPILSTIPIYRIGTEQFFIPSISTLPVFSLCKAFSYTQCTNTLPMCQNAHRSENLRPWCFSIATIEYNSPQYRSMSILITENGSLHPSLYAGSKVSLLPTIGAVKFLYSLFAPKKNTPATKIPVS